MIVIDINFPKDCSEYFFGFKCPRCYFIKDSRSKVCPIKCDVDDIKTEIIEKHFNIVEKNDFDNSRTYGYEECLGIINKYTKENINANSN